jgi:predicted nucleic acid-binding protein
LRLAYVDTSFLLGIAFEEPGAARLIARLLRFDRLFSSNLLEAEFRSALAREGISESGDDALRHFSWVYPNRPLSPEFERVLNKGNVTGVDLWHLANALFLAPDSRALSFLTLDRRQQDVAVKLGFPV